MADPIRQRGFVTHRQVTCSACGVKTVIPANTVGKIPCGGCNAVLGVTKGSDKLTPTR